MIIAGVCAESGVEWAEIDITTDPARYEQYWEQIPVTLVDGEQHDYWRVEADRLRAVLAAPPGRGRA